MKKFVTIPICLLFFAFFSVQTVSAVGACDSGDPNSKVGDKCVSGVADICCKVPDGDATQSLICDATAGSPTQGTCIRSQSTGQTKSECDNDSQCDKNKNLRCVNKKCVAVPCSHANGACGGANGTLCCSNENLTCSQAGTCQASTTCKKSTEACTSNTDCCQGEHLTCDTKTKKCTSTCLTKGQQCSSSQASGTTGCCDDQGLVCDTDKTLNPNGAPQCVLKTELDKGRKEGIALPTPPPPPCQEWNNGQCTTFGSAVGKLATNPSEFIRTIFALMLSLSGGIALLLTMRSGYAIMTSQGKPEQLKQGQEQLSAAIVGLVFLIFSFVILQVIGYDILRIPGFGGANGAGAGTGAGGTTLSDVGGPCGKGSGTSCKSPFTCDVSKDTSRECRRNLDCVGVCKR